MSRDLRGSGHDGLGTWESTSLFEIIYIKQISKRNLSDGQKRVSVGDRESDSGEASRGPEDVQG